MIRNNAGNQLKLKRLEHFAIPSCISSTETKWRTFSTRVTFLKTEKIARCQIWRVGELRDSYHDISG